MTADLESFSVMDFMLLTNGLQLFPKTGIQKFLNFLFKLIILAYNYMRFVKYCMELKIAKDRLGSFVWASYYLVILMSYHWFWGSSSQISAYLRSVLKQCGSREKQSIKRCSYCLLLLWFIGFLTDISSDLLYWYVTGNKEFLESFFIPVVEVNPEVDLLYDILCATICFFVCMFSTNWFTLTALIYFYFVYCINKATQVYFRVLCMRQLNSSNLLELRGLWHNITSSKKTFNDLFDMFPFLWCFFLFISLCCVIVSIRYGFYGEDNTEILIASEVLFYLIRILAVVPILLITDHYNDTNEGLVYWFIGKGLNQKEDETISVEFHLLVMEIKDNYEFKLTGWKVFKFNKGLIMAFVGSLIPFSVLIFQLF